MMPMQRHWDIFCRVIDNFGDIGVCWRLARQLVNEHNLLVRLWVDDLSSLKMMHPDLDLTHDVQWHAGVEIRHWLGNSAVDRVGEVIIEAFACELPKNVVAAMAACDVKPWWINLEYLSAEKWIDGCHGMASPHPTWPLVKHFFFPGFSSASGGLLRESALIAQRKAAASRSHARKEIEISLFCYETAPIGELINCLATAKEPVLCHIPAGKALDSVKAHLGGDGPWQLGKLTIRPVLFLSQHDYDRLLWRCDINFVRGEDSFLRAQWAGKPFVWQIYEQDDAAHRVKLDAFLDRYLALLQDHAQDTVRRMFHAWNGDGHLATAWENFLGIRSELTAHGSEWADRLAMQPDLARALVNFCAAKV